MKKRGLLILLLLLLLLSIGGNYYLYKEHKNSVASLTESQKEIEALLSSKDSLLIEIENLQEELALVWDENQLGVGKIDELEAFGAAQQKTINYLRRKLANAGNTTDLKKITLEMETLKKEKEILSNDNLSAKEKIAALSTKNNTLTEENTALKQDYSKKEKLLAKAQQPNYNNIVITPIRVKKGELLIESSAKRVEYLQIKLQMFANPLTGKTFLIPIKLRITMPDGAIMSKIEKTLTDKSKIYTLQELIGFEGKEKKMNWEYKHHSDYQKGVYNYELFAGDDLIQMGSFQLD